MTHWVMTIEEFYQGLPDAMEVGTPEDFLPDVVYTKLGWWDSLMVLRLLDYLEMSTGKVVSSQWFEQHRTWGDLAAAVVR